MLADNIISTNYQCEVKKVVFKVGSKINFGEKSFSGLYALVSNKGDVVLRISIIKGIPELHYYENSRYLAKAWLV